MHWYFNLLFYHIVNQNSNQTLPHIACRIFPSREREKVIYVAGNCTIPELFERITKNN